LSIKCVEISERNSNNSLFCFSIELFLIFNFLVNASKNVLLIEDLKVVTNIIKLNFAILIIKIVKIQNTINNKRYNNCLSFANKTILI